MKNAWMTVVEAAKAERVDPRTIRRRAARGEYEKKYVAVGCVVSLLVRGRSRPIRRGDTR